MCGIIAGFGEDLSAGLAALIHRGPDAQATAQIGDISLGHTRLSIIDVSDRSNQPFQYGDTTIVFNGEIWNYRQLRSSLELDGCRFRTESDTEVLAAVLNRYGPAALNRIEGMFAAAWTDRAGQVLRFARDSFGEVPLHFTEPSCEGLFGIGRFMLASEKKALIAAGVRPESIIMCPPGHYGSIRKGERAVDLRCFYFPKAEPSESRLTKSRAEAAPVVRKLIELGAEERTIADVPVCTLLSGGIDSAAVALTLKRHFPNLVAYTAVHKAGSKDHQSARLMARELGIELREVEVPTPSVDDLSEVIRIIEMPYKAQVEIGWACLVLARQMQKDGFKVTFSGEGSDELWASYGFAYHALQTEDWHEYRRDLYISQNFKNFARCNKIFMAHSIECRLPFLNRKLAEFALSLPRNVVQDGSARPKAVIQDAFSGILPDVVTRRAKVAFQDGCGLKDAIAKAISNPRQRYLEIYRSLYGN
jgi:asparagine synthase (glutamine-hydrolysing)